MFTTPAPSAPTLSTNTSAASPSSPTRASRLRGLQYLRSYTHNHLHSHSTSPPPASLPPVTRARTTPLEGTSQRDSSARTIVADSGVTTAPNLPAQEASSIQRSSSPGSTGGWLPAVGLRSGLSRLSTGPDSAPSRETLTVTQARADRPLSTSSISNTSMRTMTRHRAETAAPVIPNVRNASTAQPAQRTISAPDVHVHDASAPPSALNPNSQLPTIRFSSHQDNRSNRPSLIFPSISRTLPSPSAIIKVGRYSERDSTSGVLNEANPATPSSAPVGFKSKVVSRRHCEFWCSGSQWYIKDVGSSSGTFLNHIRLSQPGVESKPYVVNDGDVVQLGIDFRGGEEMIFRCVKIRVECNRGWQKGLNSFNKSTHKRLRNLARTAPKKDSDTASMHTSECSICLMSIAPCQSLFVAPCSHVWHYKCIRPILNNGSTYPNFLCPNCRAVADLEADVEEEEVEWSEDEDVEKDPDMKRAIQESLEDGKPNGTVRTDGEGEPIRSLDVTDARESSGTVALAPPVDLDTTAGAIGGRSANNSRSREHSAHSYGQGSNRSNDNIRTPRPQRSFRSARSGSGSARAERDHATTMVAEDAELAALVAGMNFTAPDRTPPPPPPQANGQGSQPIAIAGGGSRKTSVEHRSKNPRHTDVIDAASSRRGGNEPPAPSPMSPNNHNAHEDGISGVDSDGEETGVAVTTNGIGDGRSSTPGDPAVNGGRRASPAEIGGPDCPMTPRNDAGPFILDGSAGR